MQNLQEEMKVLLAAVLCWSVCCFLSCALLHSADVSCMHIPASMSCLRYYHALPCTLTNSSCCTTRPLDPQCPRENPYRRGIWG